MGQLAIDSAAAFGGNENSRSEVRAFVSALDAWACSARCAVLLISHPSKASEGEAAIYSGSTDWRNSVRALWELRAVPISNSKRSAVRLRNEKASYGLDGAVLWLGGYPQWLGMKPDRCGHGLQTGARVVGTDSMTREKLIQARETARTPEEIIRAVARIEHTNAHDGAACPPDRIPTEAALAAWLPNCPDKAKRETEKLTRDLFKSMSLSSLIRAARLAGVSSTGVPTSSGDLSVVGGELDPYRSNYGHQTRTAPRQDRSSTQFERSWALEKNVDTRLAIGAVHRSAPSADGIDDPEPITDESLERLPGRIAEEHEIVAVHAAWLASGEEGERGPHPLSPIIRAWQERPDSLAAAIVTATVGDSPMVKRPALISDLARTAWDDAGTVEAATVDGEALAARIPDAAAVHRPRMRMLKPKPSEQMGIEWPRGLKPRIRPDMRLTALEGMPPILAGDLSMIVTMAYALNRPICLTETEGAALLARTRTGEFRRPRESDRERFRRAWVAGRWALIVYDPHDTEEGGRAVELLDAQSTASGLYVIGPPLWARQLAAKGERWTLTGEGSAASARRSLAGKLAGRIVTGLEYRLGARWDGKLGIAPDLRPDSGKTGPGPVVFVGWREVLNLWREPRRIALDADAWKADLTAHQNQMAAFGDDLAFEIARIEDSIQIRAVLHTNQDDPRFGGRGNPNLSGEATSRIGNGRSVVEAEAIVEFPLYGPPPSSRSSRAPYDGLVTGESYRLSRETPLHAGAPRIGKPGLFREYVEFAHRDDHSR